MLKDTKTYVLFAALLVSCRVVAFGASVGDAIVVSALAGLYAYLTFLKTKEQAPVADQFKQELDNLKSAVNSLKLGKTFGR